MVKTTATFRAKLINGHFILFASVVINGSSFLQSVHWLRLLDIIMISPLNFNFLLNSSH